MAQFYFVSPLWRNVVVFSFTILTGLSISAQEPFPAMGPIYSDNVVPRIDILLPADSLAAILAPGNEQSDYEYHATMRFDNGTIKDTFENVGLRLRGNTSRYSAKKSFRVSLNSYAPGRSWYGVEKLNLNGEHNDPTVSRSKVCWDLLRAIGVPAPRANHIELYINGDYFGLCANTEHIDEEFVNTRFGNNDGNLYKCTWPADMVYLGQDPDLYKYTSGNSRAYELHINEELDDYSDLAHLIDILNNTPANDLPCQLEEVFNINSFLMSMAFDILSGNWDGPHFNKNNFYLYHNLATGLFEYIPFDLDNTFGIDWFGIDWSTRDIYAWGESSQPRPFYWRILAVPEYKDRLSYYINRILTENYNETTLFPHLDSIRTLIAPSVADDYYYTLDYGFTIDDFNDGFEEALPYFHTKDGIKSFIESRKASALDQLHLVDIAPILQNVSQTTASVGHPFALRIDVEDDEGIAEVKATLEWNESGSVEVATMYDDGQHNDEKAGDGLYGVLINAMDTCSILEYEIVAADLAGHQSRFPVCGNRQLSVCTSTLTLSINEIMASNTVTIVDEYDEYEDWVEIFNYGTEPINLGDLYLSDKSENPTKWRFPNITIQGGEYLLVWADEDGSEGDLHANFKLSADGEFIGIYDKDANNNTLIDGIAFGEQLPDQAFGRFPNGTGAFKILPATPGSMNEETSFVSEETISFPYSIFPNPAHDVLYLRSVIPAGIQANVALLDIFGKVMIKRPFQNEVLFEVGDLPPGVFVVCMITDNGLSMLGKVIKD